MHGLGWCESTAAAAHGCTVMGETGDGAGWVSFFLSDLDREQHGNGELERHYSVERRLDWARRRGQCSLRRRRGDSRLDLIGLPAWSENPMRARAGATMVKLIMVNHGDGKGAVGCGGLASVDLCRE
ncbi:hypothetical protein M0R45_035684 [Rubus argutus]|uniref:Uncharacterized protein n=1 Tax=Rubus argutus TaxID=59490 RepID=A0AAW1VY63_RUBAR